MIKEIRNTFPLRKAKEFGTFQLPKKDNRDNDMTEADQIMHRAEKVDRGNFLSLSHNTRTEGHPIKVMINRFRAGKGKHFFNSLS